MRIYILVFTLFCASAIFAMDSDQLAPQTKSSNEDEWCVAVNKIIEKVTKAASENSKYSAWKDFFKATECQTNDGLILECNEEDLPIAIHMQIGTWRIAYTSLSDYSNCAKNVFLPTVELKEFEGSSNDFFKDELISLNNLRLYSVLKVDGIVLPQPKFREKKNFISISEALERWAILKKQPSRSNK